MHIELSDLRAHLDGALPEAAGAVVTAHLAQCAECRAAQAALEARAAHVHGRLALLAPAPNEAEHSAPAARQSLRIRQRKDRTPMVRSLTQRRSVWVGAAAVLALALSFSFTPVRTFAGQFLGLFRVQQIAVVPVDMARLEGLHDDPTLIDQLSRMFADTVVVTRQPGDAVQAASAGEASALAGFNVRVLGGASGEPSFTVQDGAAFEVVIDQPQAQVLLNEAGRSDLVLPASLDGATIAIDIPAGVNVAYNCAALERGDGEQSDVGVRSTGEMRGDYDELSNCVLFGQIPSPSVETPPNLDMAQLAEIGLQVTGMSPEEARAFSNSVDWTSTLVVPIPMNTAASRQVQVDGVTGTLVHRPADDTEPSYTLMWVKDGIVYALSGFGTPDEAVALGNSIQ